MTRNILQYPDPRLFEKSKEINKEYPNLDILIKTLKKLARENSIEDVKLVGLSAPQIGENVRVFVYYDSSRDDYIEVINPELIYTSKELSIQWEGCASVGSGADSLFGPVMRSKSCQIKFFDINWRSHLLNANGYLSHVIQHEIDHLNGIIFLNKVIDPSYIMTSRQLNEYFRKYGEKYPKIK